MRKLDFGLWTLSPRCSAVFPTLSPRSIFPTGQWFPTLARGHVMSASRNVLSFLNLSPRSTGQRFPTPNHMTSAFPITSGSGDVISG